MRSFFINYQKFSYGDQNKLAFINEQFTYLAFWWYELGAEMKSAMYYNTWGVMLCWDFWSINAGILIHFMHNFVGGKILQCKSFESVNQSLEIAFSTPTTCTASQKLFVFWNIIPTLLHFFDIFSVLVRKLVQGIHTAQIYPSLIITIEWLPSTTTLCGTTSQTIVRYNTWMWILLKFISV